MTRTLGSLVIAGTVLTAIVGAHAQEAPAARAADDQRDDHSRLPFF